MPEYLVWAALVIYPLSLIVFYFRMRRVGNLLGGHYKTRMDIGLTLAVVIPLALSFVFVSPDIISAFIIVASMVSFSAGLIMIPGVLIDSLTEKKRKADLLSEADEPSDSFEDQVQEVLRRQRMRKM